MKTENTKAVIHHISEISFFSTIRSEKYKSKVEMIQAHFRYLDKNSVASVGSKDMILSTAKMLDKKVNSRVAMKFNIAIPNDIPKEKYQEFLNEIADFLENQFNIDKRNIYIVLHDKHKLGEVFGTMNKHVHVVANTLTKDDKRLRLHPKDLRELHKNWDKFLTNHGYKVREKDETSISISHLGFELRKDKELQSLYKEYIDARKGLDNIDNTMTM